MSGQLWGVASAAFLASGLEFVEALTIVLAVGLVHGWRTALSGGAVALAILVVLVGSFGMALARFVPIGPLRFGVGLLLLLFGMGWLKKAILRAGGARSRRDEAAIFERERARLDATVHSTTVHSAGRMDPVGFATAFKGVLLEGLEVAFIVVGLGTQPAGLLAASGGALTALLVVIVVGSVVHAPLRRVPENTMAFVVGIALTSFGTFWGGEGLGIAWPGADASLLLLAACFGTVALLLVSSIRRPTAHRAPAS